VELSTALGIPVVTSKQMNMRTAVQSTPAGQ
jgi:hypothetical protein